MNTFLIIVSICGGSMTIVGALAWLVKSVKSATKPLKTIQYGLRAVLRNSIVRTFQDCKKSDSIDTYTFQSVMEMHRQYKSLDGNGFVDELIDDMKRLPMSN